MTTVSIRSGFRSTGIITLYCLISTIIADNSANAQTIRFATYNASLNRRRAGELVEDLQRGDEQAKKVAEIIQRIRPDILLINEFDYDADGRAAELFHDQYLAQGQRDQQPIEYRYRFLAPVNTGVPTGMDLNRDGRSDSGNDAFGFGNFPGQYGMVVFSKFPILESDIRTFQNFRWADMPDAALPTEPGTNQPYFTDQALEILRLSSKSHWDVPIQIENMVVHLLASHPTPPVFDGPEDRNGRRNHDEIRLFADYIDPSRSNYIYDDKGRRGGLAEGAHFVIVGDLNADPIDGDDFQDAARQLTDHSLINAHVTPESEGGAVAAREFSDKNSSQKGNPRQDTSNFSEGSGPGNLRVDYVLPSATLTITDKGIFWPAPGEDGADLVDASDHRAVWIEVPVEAQ